MAFNTKPSGFAYEDMQLNGTSLVNVPTTGADVGIGIGGGVNPASAVQIGGILPTDSAITLAVEIDGAVPSGTTSAARVVRSSVGTQAASFTLSSLAHFTVNQGTFGAGSTVTDQYGFLVQSGTTGATNNYGFFSDLASGSGRWNFFAAGTAPNYMAGTLQAGSTISVGNATPAASGAGVTFPATQSASSDANTLDDYEEGDWTPTYVSTGATFTYNSNTGGKYTKIGNRVYISGFLQTDSASGGTAANAVQIGGLPFTVAAWGPGRDYSLILCDEVEEFAGDYPSAARAQPNDAVATLFYRDTADGASIALRYDDLATGSSDNLMGFTGFYRTA